MPLCNEATLSASASTSSSLLQRVIARDAEAWRQLSTLYAPVVLHWARHYKLNDHDAADVVQEVFQAVATHIQQFRHESPGDSFRGWLWTITRNKIRDHFRRLAHRPPVAGGTDALRCLEQVPDAPPVSASDESHPGASAGFVRQVLDMIRGDFEPNTWEAFWRSTVEGHTTDDIARDLGLRKPAVRQAKYRVLQSLRQQLRGLL